MKFPAAVPRILAALLVALFAAAQSQPGSEKKGPQKKEPLFFVKVAADVAGNVQSQSLNNFLAVYVAPENWASGLADSDLGPFLKVKEAKPDRSAACLFSDAKDVGICVYFDADTPFGVAAVKAGAGGKIEASAIPAAYKAVTRELLKKGDKEFRFTEEDLNTDDGIALPGFRVTTP